MIGTDVLNALNGNAGAADEARKPSKELGQNEFLKLMLAQLKNQDPMKPTDPTAFLSQLAQFSTVTGVQNMQSSLENLTESLRSSQVLSGATLVGRDVLAPSSTTSFTAGTTLRGAADLPDGASTVQITVRDSAGQQVRSFSIPAQQGLAEFSWDGLTDGGGSAPTGTYQIQVVANIGGEGVSVDPLLASRVASVSIEASGLVLNTSVGPIAINDVRRVM
jgi:flagellar basal-body rod modification protein FlgD